MKSKGVLNVNALEAALLQFSANGARLASILIETLGGTLDYLGVATNKSLALGLAISANLDFVQIRRLAKDPGVDMNARLPGLLNAVETSVIAKRLDVFDYLISDECSGVPSIACIGVAASFKDPEYLSLVCAKIPDDLLEDPFIRIEVFTLIGSNYHQMLQHILVVKPAWARAVEEHQGGYINIFGRVIAEIIGNAEAIGPETVELVHDVLTLRSVDENSENLADDNLYCLAVIRGLPQLATLIRDHGRIEDPDGVFLSLVRRLPKRLTKPELFDLVVAHIGPENVSVDNVIRLIRQGRVVALASLHAAQRLSMTPDVLLMAALETDDDPDFVRVFAPEFLLTLNQEHRDKLSFDLGHRARGNVLSVLLNTEGIIDIARVFEGLLAPLATNTRSKRKMEAVLDLIVPHPEFPDPSLAITLALNSGLAIVFSKLAEYRPEALVSHITSMDDTKKHKFILQCLRKPDYIRILAIVHEYTKIVRGFEAILPTHVVEACSRDQVELVAFLKHAEGIEFDLNQEDNIFFRVAFQNKARKVYQYFVESEDAGALANVVISQDHLNEVIKWGDEAIALHCVPLATKEQRNVALVSAVEKSMRVLLKQLIAVDPVSALADNSCAFRTAVESDKIDFVEDLAPHSDATTMNHFALFRTVEKRNLRIFRIVIGMRKIDLYAGRGAILNSIAKIERARVGKEFLSALLEKAEFSPTHQKLTKLYEMFEREEVPKWMAEGLVEKKRELGVPKRLYAKLGLTR